MQPTIDQALPLLGLDMKVVLLGLSTAALSAAGLFLQKMNGLRAGNLLVSGWLVMAIVCFAPTFFITNKVFSMGGRMSVYVPVTAATYVLSMLAARFYFAEAVSWPKWFGCALIVAGVSAIVRG
jgi:uncharacterized membrane protein